MKVKLLKKQKNNKYIVFFEKEELSLYDEVILKYHLFENKVIDNNILGEIKEFNNTISYYYKCINKIKYKRRTEKELTSFLLENELEEESINFIIDKLKKLNLINDLDYIKAYISDKANLSNDGENKIINELVLKGLNKEDVLNELSLIDKDIWISKINKEIEKRIRLNKKYSKKELINNIKIHLYKKGFNNDDINNEINNYDIEEDLEILENKYNKLLNKYKDKQKVINNLITLGYNLEDIKNIEN